MKIALVTHNVVRGDGQGRVNYELVRHCRGVGIGVNIISEKLAPEILDTGAVWNRLGLWINKPDLLHCMHFTPRANGLVRQLRSQVDLVVANGAVLREPHAVNICHFVHGAWSRSNMHDSRTKRGPAAWYHAAYAKCNVRWERQAFNAAENVVGVSAQVREELIGIGIDEAKVRVIVNGVDLAEFHPGEESREKLGLPAIGPLALFVGGIRTPRKNLDGVLRAVQKIPQMQLAVVGDETQSPFPAMAQKMGLGDRVRFLGYRRDVPKLMRACDMFVFPSRYEACSLALLEALASGLPVISAKTAGGSELISPECGHVLSDPEDLNGLVGAITRFMDTDVRGKAKIAARRVAEEHGWSQMGRQYVELFEEHLRKQKPARSGRSLGMSQQPDQEPRLLIFATQGSGHGDEARIVELTSKLHPQLFPFNRAGKFGSFRQLLSTLKKTRPTLVIMEGTGIAGGAAVMLGRILHGVHYVVSSGDAIAPFLSMKKPLLGPIFRAYERWLYRLSSGFIGWTPYLVGRALTMGSPRGMTAAGWAPWSKSDAELAAGRARVRAQWNIPEDAVVFGIVGSLDWNDRVEFCYGSELVRAAVLAKRVDLRILIAGDGSGMQHLKDLAGDELGRTIILTGRVPREQVIDYLAAMDVGSLPQSVDGVGSFRYTIKLSEYLAAHLPTVTGEIPLAYDLNDGWLWRLPGDSPWDPRYIRAMADLMRTLSLQQINGKRGWIPRDLRVFDKASQIERTTQFIGDLCAALRA